VRAGGLRPDRQAVGHLPIQGGRAISRSTWTLARRAGRSRWCRKSPRWPRGKDRRTAVPSSRPAATSVTARGAPRRGLELRSSSQHEPEPGRVRAARAADQSARAVGLLDGPRAATVKRPALAGGHSPGFS
jgi:hypothetical protein